MSETDLLNTLPTLQAAALITRKRKKKGLLHDFSEDIVGIGLIKATRSSI